MSTNYWYIRENKLKFVDAYGDDSAPDPVIVRYRRRLNAEIRNADDALFSKAINRYDDDITPDQTIPLPPRLLSPENGSDNVPDDSDVTISWAAASSGSSPTLYSVYISYDPDADISEWMVKEVDASQTSILYSDFSGDSGYVAPRGGQKVYWTVTAYNRYGESRVPDMYYYAYKTIAGATLIPNVPTLTSPADDAENVALLPTLDWSVPAVDDTHEAASGYIIDISSSTLGVSIFTEDSDFTFISSLDYGTEYTWKVAAFNDAGQSAYSTERTFTTTILPQGYLWEEQDDGLDIDIQLAALYLALSRGCDLAGGDAKTSKYFFDKYNHMQKELRIKYNSAKYKNITIRPYSF